MNQLNTTWMTDAPQHLYDRLLTRAPDGTYVPHLASWTISADKLAWTFRLRPGVRFHGGDPLTSEAVRWWSEQARDPKGFYGFKGQHAGVQSVPGVAIALVVLGFNLLGDGLRDVLDPRMQD
jgi:ABC-type transport system substrate-binding protein